MNKIFLIVLYLFIPFVMAGNNKGDFEIKGFHIDLRDEVMTMEGLKKTAYELSQMGLNTLIMEWEATFPYTDNATLCNQFAYTKDEVRSFIKYCDSLSIDVIPLQNCFGHSEYILRHDRYAHLKEDRKEVSQICPLKIDECKKVFRDLFREMVELHPSKYLHIGGDETYLLGHCKKCASKAEKEGKSKLFVDYVKVMCELAKEFGKTPILWADIILKYPEAVSELPKDAIFVDWNYGWKRDYFGNMNNLFNAGVSFWGAPAIRSHPDNLYLTKLETHFNNQRDFIPYARKAKYKGIIMTSWSTSGTYGYKYDTNWEVIDMYPVRHVYPLSGFRILLTAYGESVNSTEVLNPEKFVEKYSVERFGLNSNEAKILWHILKYPQEVIIRGKDRNGRNVSDIKDEAIVLQSKMSTLLPKKNIKEFEHLRLMLDLRVEYLKFKTVETKFQSNSFTRKDAVKLLECTKKLISAAELLNARFYLLNKGFIHDEEIKRMNKDRVSKLHSLHEILKKLT